MSEEDIGDQLIVGLVELGIGIGLLGLASRRVFGIGQVGSPPGAVVSLVELGLPVDALYPWLVLLFQVGIGIAAVYSGSDSFREIRGTR